MKSAAFNIIVIISGWSLMIFAVSGAACAGRQEASTCAAARQQVAAHSQGNVQTEHM